MFRPTVAFWFSLSPLPIIWFLNIIIFFRMRKVRQLAGKRKIKRPQVYKNGTVISLISLFFVILPALLEGRLFVQNPYWILVYVGAGIINIIGLSMVLRGIDMEIRSILNRKKHRLKPAKHNKRSSSGKPLTMGS